MLKPLEFAKLHGVNPETGLPLSFVNHRYLCAPLEDLAPRVVLQKGAQVGATVLAVLKALWFVCEKEAQSLILFPTHQSAQRFSRGRLAVLLERSPYLRRRFRAGQSIRHMRAGTVNLYCHGARSRTELLSMPIQYLTIDERDELYQTDIYAKAGWSALALARQRLAGQAENWELNLSTPTLPGRGIAAEYLGSDQRRFQVRCPCCRRWVGFAWPASVVWSDVADSKLPPSYRCGRCGELWSEEKRREILQVGRWYAQAPGQPVHGYHMPQLLAPALTAHRLVAGWREAQASPAALQVFHNSILGEPFLADGARLSRHLLDAAVARAGYAMADDSPHPTVLGVDVGPSWLHAVVLLPLPRSPRLVWVGKLPDWNELAGLVRRFRVRAFVIDAQPETHAARRFIRDYPHGALCYYRQGGSIHFDPTTRTLHAPRTETLDGMFQRLRRGELELPRDVPAEFLEQLTAPARLLRLGRDGQVRAVYEEIGPDHYAHALNYALLAAALPGGVARFEVALPRSGQLAWE